MCSRPWPDEQPTCRFALYDALTWLQGVTPSEGLLIGLLVLGSAAACSPLLRFRLLASSLRVPLVLAAGLGCLLVLLQPPLPIQACPVSWGWMRERVCHPA